jgi:transcriptional regulator with XRE-family HTH domain
MREITAEGEGKKPRAVASSIARRIVWFRVLRGYTQDELGRRSGLSTGSVTNAESGHSQTTLRTLDLLAAALDTTAGVLLGYSPLPAEAVAADELRRRF